MHDGARARLHQREKETTMEKRKKNRSISPPFAFSGPPSSGHFVLNDVAFFFCCLERLQWLHAITLSPFGEGRNENIIRSAHQFGSISLEGIDGP